MIRGKITLSWQYVATLLIANLFLLLPNANALRVASGLLLVGILPGLSWANRLLPQTSLPLRVTIAAGISYAITNLVTLLLHYLPGPVSAWQILVALNILALLPMSIRQGIGPLPSPLPKGEGTHTPAPLPPRSPALLQVIPFLLILAISIFMRTANLNYSEFQGDEALAMISAAEALEGHEEALFLRSKGPGEVLLPMALWRLTGTITEAIARLPFTVASLFAIVTIYLIGLQLAGNHISWVAAGFFALNGFMVAFGRIVQYQVVVVWMSALAFLMLLHWQSTHQYRFAFLGGLFLGAGLLAHYDAILVAPALLWLLLFSGQRSAVSGQFKAMLLFAGATLLVALPFYLPYALDPQANRTGAYVGERIGNELRNNLPDFFHFNIFYSSSYYLIISGLLLLIVCLWILWQAGNLGQLVGLLATLGIVAVVIYPNQFEQFAFLPFAILLFSVFLTLLLKKSSPLHPSVLAPLQAVIVWLAVPFLGYNFVVALGLTHIYTTVPAWALLAALGWNQLTMNNEQLIMNNTQKALRDQSPIPNLQSPFSNPQSLISNLLLAVFFITSTIFLWNAFVRHDVEYWQDYPEGNLSMFWTPYTEPPQAGFFGFAHRAGWKAIGQKIAAGELSGDYGSNEEPDVTTWYTRGAPRACDPQPEYYFLADDLIDPIDVPQDIIKAHYQEVGQVILLNQKQMRTMQQIPIENGFAEVDEAALASAFDSSSTPTAFARSARGAISRTANFDNQIQLIGYDLDTRRAYPGGRVPVTLYWRAVAPLSTGYQVFTHLESESGPAAQSDGVPVCWTYPTDVWRPGQIIADQHAIALSPDIAPGQYPLEIGLYLPDTFERLDILDEAGNPAGTSLTLDVVEIRKVGD